MALDSPLPFPLPAPSPPPAPRRRPPRARQPTPRTWPPPAAWPPALPWCREFPPLPRSLASQRDVPRLRGGLTIPLLLGRLAATSPRRSWRSCSSDVAHQVQHQGASAAAENGAPQAAPRIILREDKRKSMSVARVPDANGWPHVERAVGSDKSIGVKHIILVDQSLRTSGEDVSTTSLLAIVR